MGKARDNSSMGFAKSQEHKGGHVGSTKREKESPLCHTDGLMSPQECGVEAQNYRNTWAESCSGVTL